MSKCAECGGYHLPGYHDGEPAEYEDPRVVLDGAWRLLTSSKGTKRGDRSKAVGWASGYVDDARSKRFRRKAPKRS